MPSILMLASSGRSDPTLSIFLGIAAVIALAVGIYAMIKVKQKADARTDGDWQKGAEALGLEIVPAWKQWIMRGTLNGRELSISLKSIPVIVTKWTKPSEVRHLFCQIALVPLGSPFTIEPKSLYLLQSIGSTKTNIPVFDDTFDVTTTDLNFLSRLLMAKPDTMDGRVLADEMLHRTMQMGQRICLSETGLELAVKATDTSEGLAERIRKLAEQTIDLANEIEMRALSVRETVPEKFP